MLSVSWSMLAPESTIATRLPATSSLPASIAATPTAPAPSVTSSLVRDDAGDGFAQLGFADDRDLRDLAADDVEGDRVGVEVAGEPVGERRLHVDLDDSAGREPPREGARRLDLDAGHLACSSTTPRTASAIPEMSPPPPIGTTISVDVRPVVEYLEPDRAGAGDDVRMAVR